MKIRTFELCAGYDSQLMALERLKKKYSDFDYECIGWSEIEPSAIALHNACFPSLSGKNFGDMTKIDWSKVADFDLLTYSTPCQSVSQAGKQKGNAADCGVPQNRKRVFMLSIRNDGDKIDYHFPRKTKLEKHLVDVLEENVDEKYFFSDDLLCKEKFVSNEWKEPMSAAIRTRSEGKWIKGEKHSPKVELGKNIANTITSASKDSLVVLGETRLCIRRLTPRELFRLMDVDEEYIDKMLESGVPKSSLQKAAGNSIVVACMERIFEELWFPENNVKVADDGQLCLF